MKRAQRGHGDCSLKRLIMGQKCLRSTAKRDIFVPPSYFCCKVIDSVDSPFIFDQAQQSLWRRDLTSCAACNKLRCPGEARAEKRSWLRQDGGGERVPTQDQECLSVVRLSVHTLWFGARSRNRRPAWVSRDVLCPSNSHSRGSDLIQLAPAAPICSRTLPLHR